MNENDEFDSIIYDIRPKRRHLKDAPYILLSGTDRNDQKHYFVDIKNSASEMQRVEIDEQTFAALDAFELEDLAKNNRKGRNRVKQSFDDAQYGNSSTEIAALWQEQKEQLRKLLAEKQYRRLYMYCVEERTYQEIAAYEHCTISPVKRPIDAAKKILNATCSCNLRSLFDTQAARSVVQIWLHLSPYAT